MPTIQLAGVSTPFAHVTKDSLWVPITAAGTANWISVQVSPNGLVVLAVRNGNGNVGISYNGGTTWVYKTTGAGNWIGSCVMSENSQTMYAMGNLSGSGSIGRSLDGGATWADMPNSRTGEWFSCGCSADGSILYAGKSISGSGTGGLYKSTDYGVTYTLLPSAGTRVWRSIAVSQVDSNIVYASTGSGGFVYKTIDGGTTWNAVISATGRDWYDIRCSHDGNTIIVSDSYGYPWTSTNGGSTWTMHTSANSNPNGCAVSADGTMFIVRNFISLDGGATWDRLNDAGASWQSVGASALFENIVTGVNLSTYLYHYLLADSCVGYLSIRRRMTGTIYDAATTSGKLGLRKRLSGISNSDSVLTGELSMSGFIPQITMY
jgi:hypothetical protein